MTKTIIKIKLLRNLSIKSLNIIFGLGLIISAAFYLFMVNNVGVANYQKTMLQKDIDNLRMEIRGLNLELSDKRNIGFLEKAAQNLHLVDNDQIQYIKIAGSVAKNQ